jgi:pyruvate/2-oxoglutarate dehydrogenase complex dihydrolipoamide acyltransferase (E2) component
MQIVHIVTEVDITDAIKKIRDDKKKSSESFSLTPYLTLCLARAVDENKRMNAYKKGNKLIMFDDVDVCVVIEREIDGEKIPVFPYIVRAANNNNLSQIQSEIKAAQYDDSEINGKIRQINRYSIFPGFIRKLFWKLLFQSPYRKRKVTGTVGITSIGMFIEGSSWLIPVAPYTLNVSIGGLSRKLLLINGKIENREMLSITISFDHNIVDGAYTARFIRRLKELIENSYGIND